MTFLPRLSFLLGLSLCLALGVVHGQAPTTPRPMPPGPIVSPEIAPDRQVTFRLKAEKAQEIKVNGQWTPNGTLPMTRGDDGVWSATVGPVESGIYEYSFTVDGLPMIDPGNPAIKPQRQPRVSILQVPGEPPLVWDFQNVPHGTLHAHTYFSPSLGHARELVVYTPPGYETATTKFPLLVLIHGFGDNQAAWSQHGKAHWIMDNLIAQKKAVPMIVVMPDGHPISPTAGPREEYGRANTAAFERELLEEILPLVESNYRGKEGAEAHAIAGLSMGGGHALNCGLRHLDRFAWVGSFSGGMMGDRLDEALKDPAQINDHAKLLWIAIGKDDGGRTRNEQMVANLDAKGIRHVWRLTEGKHAWPVWRNYFSEFAPLLFR